MRSDDEPTLTELGQRYRHRLVDDDREDLDFGLSVHGAPQPSGSRLLPSLVHGRQPLLRSRNVGRLISRLAIQLGVLESSADDETIPVSRTGALAANGQAVLLPEEIFAAAGPVERAAHTAGASIVEPVGLGLKLSRTDPTSLMLRPQVPLDGRRTTSAASDATIVVGWGRDILEMGQGDRAAARVARALRYIIGNTGQPDVDQQWLAAFSAACRRLSEPVVTPGVRPDVSRAIDLLQVSALRLTRPERSMIESERTR